MPVLPVRISLCLALGSVVLGGCAGAAAEPTPRAGGGSALAAPAAGPGPQQRYTVNQAPRAGSCHYRYVQAQPLPDPSCTPGAVNPEVTPSTLQRTICARGYSARIRPPRGVTDREKRLSARAYGYTGSFATAEFDHLIPIGVGGDPNDARNLWVEPNENARATGTANGKDTVEDTLHAAVCGGRVGLAEAQRAIASDWTTALRVLGLA